MRTVHVIPSRGAKIRDSASGRRIPATGTEVTLSSFIRRRLRDGTLIEVAPDSMNVDQRTESGSQPASSHQEG